MSSHEEQHGADTECADVLAMSLRQMHSILSDPRRMCTSLASEMMSEKRRFGFL